MGTVQLPTYQPTQVETHNVREQRPDIAAKAELGQAQANFAGTVLDAATAIGGQILAQQRSSQMGDLQNKYGLARDQILRDLEGKPIDSRDPRFQDIPDVEKALPNLSAFTKSRQEMLDGLLEGVTDPRVRQAFMAWTADRWVSEKDSVAKWDAGLAKATAFANFVEDFTVAVERGDPLTARDIADAARAAGTISIVKYDEYMDLAHKDISKRGDILKAIAMGPGGGAWLANGDNLKYTTYDGTVKDMPLADREDLMKQYNEELARQEELRKLADKELNKDFEDGFNQNINSIGGLMKLRDNLNIVKWYDDGQKRQWTTTLTSRIEQLSREQAGGGGLTPEQKQILDGNIALAAADRRAGKLTDAQFRTLNRMYLLAGGDSGNFTSYDKEFAAEPSKDPSYSDAFDLLSAGAKKGPDGKILYSTDRAAQLAAQLKTFIDANPDKPKDWLQYATNLRNVQTGNLVKSKLNLLTTAQGQQIASIKNGADLIKAVQDGRLMGVWKDDPNLSEQVYALRDLGLRVIANFQHRAESTIRVTLDTNGQTTYGVPTERGDFKTYRLQSDGKDIWIESYANGAWVRVKGTGTQEHARPRSGGGGFLPGEFATELARLLEMSDLFDQYKQGLSVMPPLEPLPPETGLFDHYASQFDKTRVPAPSAAVPAWSGAPVTIDRTRRDAMVELAKLSPDPMSEVAKIDSSIFYSEALKIPFDQVYGNYQAINEAWHGRYVEPTTAWQGIKQQADYAVANRRLNLLYLQLSNGDTSPGLIKEISDAEASLPAPDAIRRGLPAEIAKWFASMAPALTTAAQLGLAAGLANAGMYAASAWAATAGSGGFAAPEAAITGAITVPSAFVAGLGVGFTTGMAQDMQRQGQGAAFRDLATMTDANGKTMDLNTARLASLAIGAVYGVLGTVQFSSLPGVRQAAVQAMDNAMRGIVVKGLMRTVGTVAGQTAKTAGQMGVLGAYQAYAEIAVKEWAKAFSNTHEGTQFDPATLGQMVEQIKTQAFEMAKAGLIMGLPGSIAEAARGIKADIPKMVEAAGARIGALSAENAPLPMKGVEAGQERPTLFQPAAHAVTEEAGVRTLRLTDPALTDRPRIDYTVEGDTVHVRSLYVPVDNAPAASDAIVALMHENRGKVIDWQPVDEVGAMIRQKLLDENPLRKRYQAIAEAKLSEAAAIREALDITTDPAARMELEQEAAKLDAEARQAQESFAGMDIQWFAKDPADLRTLHVEEARQATDFSDFMKMQEAMRTPEEPVQTVDYWRNVWEEAKRPGQGIDPNVFNKQYLKTLNDPAAMANLVRELQARGVARDISTDLERIGYFHRGDVQPLQDSEMVLAKAAVRRNIDAIKQFQASLGDEAMQRQIDYESTVPEAMEVRLRKENSRLRDQQKAIEIELEHARETYGVPTGERKAKSAEVTALEEKLATTNKKLLMAEDAITSARGEANIVARLAKRAGKIEAYAHITERIQNAKDNARAAKDYIYEKRQEAIEERQFRGKLIAGIRQAEEHLNALNPEYVKPIKDLLVEINTRTSSRRARRNLQELKDQIKALGDPDFTDAMIEDLTALETKSLADMNTPELETLSDAVKYYYKLARDQMRIWKAGKWEDFSESVIRATKQMRDDKKVAADFLSTLGKEVTTENTTGEKARFSAKRVWDTLFGIGQLHYDYMIERLAGVNSELHRVWVRALETGRDVAITYKRQAIETFHADVQAIGETNLDGWLTETRKIGRFTFTRGERLALYMHSLNPDNMAALTNSEKGGFGLRHKLDKENTPFKITAEEVMQINAELSAKERIFVEAAQKLFKAQGQEIGRVFLERNNFAMKIVTDYYPKDVMAAARGRDIEGQSALDELKLRQLMPGIPKGFTKERLGSVLPIYLNNIIDDIVSSVNKSANYIGFEMPMASAVKLLRDPLVRQHLDALYGGRVWKEIKKGLADIAGELKSYDEVSSFFRKLKQKSMNVMIGFSPFIPLKQPISYMNASVYVKARYLMQGLVDVVTHGKAIKDMHLTYSPKFWDRLNVGFTRDIAEQAKTTREMARSMVGGTPLEGVARAGTAIKKAAFVPVKGMDAKTVAATMRAAWLQAMDEMKAGKLSQKVAEGLDITEIPAKFEDRNRLAYKYADYVTARTQDMALPEYRSELSRSTSDLVQFFTMFGSSTNQNLNLLARTIREARKTGNMGPMAKAMISVLVLQPILEAGINSFQGMITKRYKNDEEARQAFLVGVLQNETSSVYFLRDLTNAVANRIGGYNSAGVEIIPTRIVNQTLDAMWAGWTALSEEDYLKKRAKIMKFLNQSADLALMWSEIPLVSPKNTILKAIQNRTK